MTTRVLTLTGIAHARRLFVRSIVRGLAPKTTTIKADDGTDVPAIETLTYVSHETVLPPVKKPLTHATTNVTCNVNVAPVPAAA